MSRVAALYPTIFLRQYVAGKTASDPFYEAVFERLRDSIDPILDAGCGIGVLAAFLRERGVSVPIRGIDHDAEKIAVARASLKLDGVDFEIGDARELPPWRGTIVLADLLHYFDRPTQLRVLARAAESAATVIIRDALRDGSWRYRITYLQESLAMLIGWLKNERLQFPTRESIVGAFPNFTAEVVPMWGRTPFNNYLFVFRRSSDGITNA